MAVIYGKGAKLWRQEPDENYLLFFSNFPFELWIASTGGAKWHDGEVYWSTNRVNWRTLTVGYGYSAAGNAVNGYKLYLRGEHNTRFSILSGSSLQYSHIFFRNALGTISCIGNMEALLDWRTVANNAHPNMAEYCFYKFFLNCSRLTVGPSLGATTLSEACYRSLFYGCSGLLASPALPATSLAAGCYFDMFYGCTSLEALPVLPATTLPTSCYHTMFSGCTNIKLSETQTGEYQYAYRIPQTGTGTEPSSTPMVGMFYNTGGTFTGTPTINTTYYATNAPIS